MIAVINDIIWKRECEMLERISISGFRSFSPYRPIDLGLEKVNLLLGANGSGKSNFISLFQLLNSMVYGRLQQYVASEGVASLLHGGPQQTSCIQMRIQVRQDDVVARYGFKLNFGLPGRLFISDETVEWSRPGPQGPATRYNVYSDSNESGLGMQNGDLGAMTIVEALKRTYLYQFNNTASGSPIRSASGIYDCAALRLDGSNLAAYLRQLREVERYRPYYQRIVALVRSVMPQFADFTLNEVQSGSVWLTWRDNLHPGYEFGPHQISDGTLRFIALAVALLSPPELMPRTIVLDEPELGLHPLAVAKLAGMIKMASVNSQVIVATQSAALVDAFDIANVYVADVGKSIGGSVIRHLSAERYREWTDQYTLSDLWEKNVIGGLP